MVALDLSARDGGWTLSSSAGKTFVEGSSERGDHPVDGLGTGCSRTRWTLNFGTVDKYGAIEGFAALRLEPLGT
eukprot:CAMPEP_0197443136 /NCGR_PEP_ID=MMETSP1175-20131217/8972_1 /TAXON_ID=1003142 /ORGANISM="Triceratium dubium, Strain CCMP147" /LENGTH=73 /DNA_ID=CAMNT_0042973733 /DNA_START=265 /DNA_END=486 /DNA_ORIENTATION=+